MTFSPSLLASLRLAEGVFRISSATLLDVALSQVSRERSDQRLAWWARHIIEVAQIDLRVEGREHLKNSEALVIMSNHQSHLDIPCLFHALTPTMRMVAKKELFRIPIFGSAMHATGFVEVDRHDRQQAIASLRSSGALLREGIPIWIAPEGTRSISGELLPFKKGGFILAMEARVPILPVGLYGSRHVLPVHAVRTRIGQRVGLVVGTPISTAEKTLDALMMEVREVIATLLSRARVLAS